MILWIRKSEHQIKGGKRMTTRKRIYLGTAVLLLLIVTMFGIREYQRNVVYRPAMTESEIAEYRKTHPLIDASPDLIEISIQDMEFYLAFSDYVLCHYKNGSFWYEDILVVANELDNQVLQHITDSGRLKIDLLGMHGLSREEFIEDQRYLILLHSTGPEGSLSVVEFYIFYVTEDDCVIGATYGDPNSKQVITSFDGLSLDNFKKTVVRNRKYMSLEARKMVQKLKQSINN